MNIKKISKILIISLILASLGGCGNTNKNSVDYNAPYYSITITSYEKLRNEYLDVDINIPKIVYTGTSTKSNLFVNSLNKQIENDVTSIVKISKQNAKDNYTKNKDKMPFGNGFNRKNIASNSDANRNKGKKPFNKGEVTGFTNSDELIIPGLHNKNIIVVETTTKEVTETSASRPNIKKPENNNKTNQEVIVNQEQNTNKEEKKNDTSIKNNDVFNSIPNTAQFTSNNRTTITCDYIVFCLDNDYISFNISINTYGNNSETKNLFYNIDLKNEKTLTIKDMVDEKNKEIDDKANFFINSNHTPITVNDDKSLSTVTQTK